LAHLGHGEFLYFTQLLGLHVALVEPLLQNELSEELSLLEQEVESLFARIATCL
jgi:hypothetical protein